MLGDEKNEELVDLATVDLGSTAILVIDELGDAAAAPEETGILAATLNTARILPLARTANVPVIFVNDAHIEGIDRELDLWGLHGLEGTPEAQTSPQLDPQEGDYTITKRRYSGFFQTGLRLLLEERGKVFSRQELIDRVWPKDVMVLDRTVDVNITRMRKKIGKFSKCIVTRLGFGYYFDA